MFGKMSFNYNMSFICDIFNKYKACRIVFGSDSSLVFKKKGMCLVELLNLTGLGGHISINIEHVDGDKICRLNINTKTGETEMYTYDAATDEESFGKISNKVRDNMLKTAKALYERRTGVYKVENTIDSGHLKFVRD